MTLQKINIRPQRPLWFKLLRYTTDLLLFTLAQLINRMGRHNDTLNILIIKTDALGDFILFTPALKAYREMYPKAHIVLLVRTATLPLAESCTYVDEVWDYNPALYESNAQRHWHWFRRLSSANIDIAIDAIYSCNDYLTTCLAAWSGAPLRYGFADSSGKKRYPRRLYINRLLSTDNNNSFEADKNAELVHFAGYHGEISHKAEIWTQASDDIAVRLLLESLGVNYYAVVSPGAQDLWRRWGIERFAKAIALAKNGVELDWLVCGSKDERKLCEDLTSRLLCMGYRAHNLAGELTLAKFACVMNGAFLCLANESMAVHMAAAYEVPTVCIVGGGHYGRFYPYPGNPMTMEVNHPLPCYHCDWICNQPSVACIEGVNEQHVANAIKSICSNRKISNMDIRTGQE